MDRLSWYLIGLWPPTLWTGFFDLFRADHTQWAYLSLCEFLIAPFVSFELCYMFFLFFYYYYCHCFYMISFVYTQLDIVFNFELWRCSCYLLCNIWCIGIEPYFTEKTEEDQTFQTFEATDEPEWDAGDGFGDVWTSSSENVTLKLFKWTFF